MKKNSWLRSRYRFSKRLAEQAQVGPHTLVAIPYGQVIMLSDEMADYWAALPNSFSAADTIGIGRTCGLPQDEILLRSMTERLIRLGLLHTE